jgi:hypothetical protein
MGESAVGFGHLMGLFAFANRGTLIVYGIHQFA